MLATCAPCAALHELIQCCIRQPLSCLPNVSVGRVTQQQHADLFKHGQFVHSVDLAGAAFGRVSLRQLPLNLKLDSLRLTNLDVQLQLGSGFEGVVASGVPLKQLQLSCCTLLDGAEGLTAALALLPGLQRLTIDKPKTDRKGVRGLASFSIGAVSWLQQLTYLELAGDITTSDQGGYMLQPLQALTAVVDLRLAPSVPATVDSSMLSGMQDLTRLELAGYVKLGERALDADTQLQHLQLHLAQNSLQGGAAETATLLFQLQPLQQLTHLGLSRCMEYRTKALLQQPLQR